MHKHWRWAIHYAIISMLLIITLMNKMGKRFSREIPVSSIIIPCFSTVTPCLQRTLERQVIRLIFEYLLFGTSHNKLETFVYYDTHAESALFKSCQTKSSIRRNKLRRIHSSADICSLWNHCLKYLLKLMYVKVNQKYESRQIWLAFSKTYTPYIYEFVCHILWGL